MQDTSNPKDDPACEPAPVITDPGAEYGDDKRFFQGIPGVERAANGRLWATWYSGGPGEGPENYVVLVTSDDDGETWSPFRLVIDPPGEVRAFDPCLWHDPDGRLWLFWAQSISWFDGRGGVWAIVTEESDADAPNWSPPRRICHGVMMNKPTVLRTGDWLLPAALWNKEKERYPELDRERLTNVIVSRDRGETWAWLGGAKVPHDARTWDEHMVVERTDGSLWMLVRTEYGIGETVSTDGGGTWTDAVPSPLAHTSSRFFLRRLSSGKMLLVKHGPLEEKTGRSHLTAYLSDDDGKTWQGGLLLDEREAVSYPDGVQAPDGTIYVIYDYQRTGDKQILLSTFTEQDVAQGEAASGRARFRVLVNQATGQRPETKPGKE